MKKQTFLLAATIMVLCCLNYSCVKKPSSALKGINRFLASGASYDAEIGIISDRVYSVPRNSYNGEVTVTGMFHGGASVSTLTVGGLVIDSLDDTTHQKSFDSTTFRKLYGASPEIVTGGEIGIPHISISDFYSPTMLNATFRGLVGTSKVSRSAGFTVSWTPDPRGSGNVYLTLYDPDASPLVSITKTISLATGTATFSSSDLSKFSASTTHLRLELAGGTDQIYPIGGKTVYVASISILGNSMFVVVP